MHLSLSANIYANLKQKTPSRTSYSYGDPITKSWASTWQLRMCRPVLIILFWRAWLGRHTFLSSVKFVDLSLSFTQVLCYSALYLLDYYHLPLDYL